LWKVDRSFGPVLGFPLGFFGGALDAEWSSDGVMNLAPVAAVNAGLRLGIFSAKSACVARPSNTAAFSHVGLFWIDPYPIRDQTDPQEAREITCFLA
jgi:hypothetical protein